MRNESKLQLNQAEATAQILDNEVIIIRLTDGTYYSMEGVGVFIWRLVEGSNDIEEIVEAVTEHYGVDIALVRKDINNLVDMLLNERLVIYDEAAKKKTQTDLAPDHNIDGAKYQTPLLNVYEDMNDLLALDPPSPGQQRFNSPDV